MDYFVFKAVVPPVSGKTEVPDIAGESQRLVWGTDGASFSGMHVDPVIPGGRHFEDPLLGAEVPLLGITGSAHFEDPLLG